MANINAKRYTELPIRYFRAIGFEFEEKHLWMRLMLIAGLLSMCLLILSQVFYVVFADDEFHKKIETTAYINYYIVYIGKMIALLYNRKDIHEVLNAFQPIYPPAELEDKYDLHIYLRQHLLIQNILVMSLHITCAFFTTFPFLSSLVQWVISGRFVRKVPMKWWAPFEMPDNWLTYAGIYFHHVQNSYLVAVVIVALDLCLYSSLLQLCMHLDIIKRNILQIEPDGSERSEVKLMKEIAVHQRILMLADRVNQIFTPSILFSLLSSSCILCFSLFQLLGEISLVIVLKAVILLIYELKQVIITCVLADKLMEMSVMVSDVVYEHKWYNGSLKYKRLVLVILMRSQRPIALNVAGISDVSLQTLRKVMSMSYQILTVLRS